MPTIENLKEVLPDGFVLFQPKDIVRGDFYWLQHHKDKGSTLQVAAAYNPVLIIRNGELIELKADRQPVGYLTGKQEAFTHHELKLERGETVYIFSDGYSDQFGGKRNKKFMMYNFKKLLLSIQDKTMNEQKTILETTMKKWKGDTEQIDDILVMGVRF